jgi:AraC family transcriptional regulator
MLKLPLPVNYGDELARKLRLAKAPSSLIKPGAAAQLAMTRLTANAGLDQPTQKITPEKAFSISLHLIRPDCSGWGDWIDGKFHSVKSWAAGGVGIYDLESDPISVRKSAFDSIHYYLSRETLNAYTESSELPTVGSLACIQGTPDPVLRHLTGMILPSIGGPRHFCDLFWDHFVLMLLAHVVRTYATVKMKHEPHRGGLAPWQKRRVTEILRERLDGGVTLSALAAECSLSASHFARSFKGAFGVPVHRYLILQRVERAKSLLTHSKSSLSEIALQCGFADQAAFSRTFGTHAGTTPGRWRREHTHPRKSCAVSIPEPILLLNMQPAIGVRMGSIPEEGRLNGFNCAIKESTTQLGFAGS